MQVENQQEIFISSPIAPEDYVWIPQSAIPKQMWCVWLSGNFCYWDVVERGPKSELSSNWARQTAA